MLVRFQKYAHSHPHFRADAAAVMVGIAAILFLLSSAQAAPASQPSRSTVQAKDFRQTRIYHSPAARGYTAWCTLWRGSDGIIRLAFEQVTGPVAEPRKRENVTFLLESRDEARTWKMIRKVPARAGVLDQNGIYAAPASSSFCGHGMAVLTDGSLITGLWAGGDRKSGYLQKSSDQGATWSKPTYLLDLREYKTYPTQIHALRDGRLIAVAGVVKQADAAARPWLLKEFFESRDAGKTWSHIWTMPPEVGLCEESDFVELSNGDLLFVHRAEHYAGNKYINSDRLQNIFHPKANGWEIGKVSKSPFPHSGFPELLKTREGPILHIAADGVWWTADAGAHWTRLNMPGSPYYPEAVQLKDGTILVVGHLGADDVYGTVDQTIVQQTFRLEMRK